MESSLHDSLMLAIMFGSGFLLSRIFIKCGIAETLVTFFLYKSKGHISLIIVFIVFLSSIISMFVPNIIAVLTMIPILHILKKDLDKTHSQDNALATALSMANLYGANIGGVGFIIGSTTNIILITFLYINKIEGAGKLNFISWIGWGVPFVIVFNVIACSMIIFLLIPRKLRKTRLNTEMIHSHRNTYSHQKMAIALSVIFFFFWIVLSAIHLLDKQKDLPYVLAIAVFYFIAFGVVSFSIKFHDRKTNVRSRLLTPKDLIADLPKKGLILVAVTLGLATLLLILKIDNKIFEMLGVTTLPSIFSKKNGAVLLISVIVTTLTVFISEFMSNTATAITFLTVSTVLCESLHIPALPILIGISIIATVPSMSPIASPVNAMAYGGIKGVSLKRMMLVGFVMDLIAIALVNLWALIYIPWYYRIQL